MLLYITLQYNISYDIFRPLPAPRTRLEPTRQQNTDKTIVNRYVPVT